MLWQREDFSAADLIRLARRIYPLNRSLTGEGVRETLAIIGEWCPGLEVLKFKSGSQVYDWTVPKEWNVREAFFEHIETGRRFADFGTHNLHLVGYSTPVEAKMSREALLEHIFVDEENPRVIPYVTSYYQDNWGFCLSADDKKSLPEGEYRVVIDSELSDGELLLGEVRLAGTSERELFFSTYICHPSMANNEVSGPVVMMGLIAALAREKALHYSYRFVFVPETIGSLAYLSQNLADLKKNVLAGFNLSCVGDNRAFSLVGSPSGATQADIALRAALVGRNPSREYSFLERGSDERQYCAPGVELPVVGFCRTKYGEFPEYHTSADNFDVVTADGLWGSLELLLEIVAAFEGGLFATSTQVGEPQLGRRGLYPNVSHKDAYDEALRMRMDALAYANGRTSVFELALLGGYPLSALLTEYELLVSAGLLRLSHMAVD